MHGFCIEEKYFLPIFIFQIVNGYFVHFFAPTNLQNLPKNVIFVIDISGSMSGREIQQVIIYVTTK